MNRRYYPDDPIGESEIRHAAGAGNWRRFLQSGVSLDDVAAAASEWADAVAGITAPWLCWGVDPDWCLEQQRQVLRVGWTPVVGYDPRVPPPLIERGAVRAERFGFLQPRGADRWTRPFAPPQSAHCASA